MAASDFTLGACDECGDTRVPVRHVGDRYRNANVCTRCVPLKAKPVADRVALALGGKVHGGISGHWIAHPNTSH
jgi:hypothetical protein